MQLTIWRITQKWLYLVIAVMLALIATSVSQPPAVAQIGADAVGDWPMVGANPQRTSWTPEQVPSADYLAAHRNEWDSGKLYPHWYRPIEPYIQQKVQIIAANDILYISTAKGLYALDAATGANKWVYPTELPLGHSPTIANGIAYVGGFDHKLHALNALTGQKLWTFEAELGFQTNPLVIGDKVFLGNRDGYFYAIYSNDSPQKGQQAWKFKTDGPILFSAAYKDGVLFFASNDSYAYALNADTGAQVWKTKLPGAGFHSWWPVVYQNYVVFAGSSNYREGVRPTNSEHSNIDGLDREVFPNGQTDPRGTPVGPRGADGWINASRITNYFEAKPWRRTYFVLNQANGQEYTFDSDGDGKKEYAPVLWAGTQSGNRYPPIVGSDGVIYQDNNFMSNEWINGGGVSGWRIGTPYINTPSAYWQAIDEPIAYSGGGNLIYWVKTSDYAAGAFDLSVPNTRFWDNGQPGYDNTREWIYWDYNLESLVPGYDAAAFGGAGDGLVFGGRNGVYGNSGDQNPPIPYKGRIYVHRGNSIIALGKQYIQTPVKQPIAATVPAQGGPVSPSREQLKAKLAAEVQKMLAAGHLRPGYMSSGHIDPNTVWTCGDFMHDYWHSPTDTLYALLLALPHLPPDLQQQTRTYLQNEYAGYLPYQVTHIGFRDGASREAFDLPPEVEADRATFGPSEQMTSNFEGWGSNYGGTSYPPHMFYALWKYAQTFGGAKAIFDASQNRLSPVPSNATLTKFPFVHNSYIAGYLGYLELQKLAGYTESSSVRNNLNNLLSLRAGFSTKDTPFITQGPQDYCRAFSVSRNFIFLVPELGDYLHTHALNAVQTAVNEYVRAEPYWFVSAYEDTFNEAIIQPLYDTNALFLAKALILKEPYKELVKYLDAPGFARGDLFYIQNLATALGFPSDTLDVSKTASRSTARQDEVVTYNLTVDATASTLTQTLAITITDILPTGLTYNGGQCTASSGATPTCSAQSISWQGSLTSAAPLVITYDVEVVATEPTVLTNQMQMDAGSFGTYARTATIIANPLSAYLPIITKNGQ